MELPQLSAAGNVQGNSESNESLEGLLANLFSLIDDCYETTVAVPGMSRNTKKQLKEAVRRRVHDKEFAREKVCGQTWL